MSTAPEPQKIIERNVTVQAPGSAAELLSQATGLSRNVIKDAMTKGAVWLRSDTQSSRKVRLRRATRQLAPGDELFIYYNAQLLSAAAPPPVLLDDQHQYSLWYKPAGLMSSGSRFGDHHSIVRQVEQRLQRPVFGVHRLDRFTCGLMLVAHGRRMAASLSRLFRERDTLKCYQARLAGELREPRVITEPVDGKSASTRVFPEPDQDDFSLVSIVIDTGRKHQIRKHLAGIGLPVAGDALHGDAELPGLQLVAYGLGFTCPVREAWVEYVLPRQYCLFEPRPLLELRAQPGNP